jgi:hypothetical protein
MANRHYPSEVSHSRSLTPPEHILNLGCPIEKQTVMDHILDNEAQTDEQNNFVYLTDRHGKSSAQTFFQETTVKVQRIASVLNR